MVKETKDHAYEMDAENTKRPLTATFTLLTLTLIGLTFQIISTFFPEYNEMIAHPSFAWVSSPGLFLRR